MKSTILIALNPAGIPEKQMQRIRSAAQGAHIIISDRREDYEPFIGEIEIAAGHFPVQWIAQAANLRWYQQWGAGTDWLLNHQEAAQKDFILTNASGVHAIPISEHILAFLLAFARRFPQACRAQHQHRWERDGNPEPFELAGKTMLLVGVGAIGQRTAQIGAAFNMRVLGMRYNPEKAVPGIERMFGPDQLDQALPEADFVVLTIPLTKETRGLMNAAAFGKMKRSAFLINIGRGATVDEPALIDALRSGQIAGAGLDVFAEEPLPADSPLWDMENVIITGHYSGSTPHYDERALEIFIDNLERYMQHQPMKNVVDKRQGY